MRTGRRLTYTFLYIGLTLLAISLSYTDAYFNYRWGLNAAMEENPVAALLVADNSDIPMLLINVKIATTTLVGLILLCLFYKARRYCWLILLGLLSGELMIASYMLLA